MVSDLCNLFAHTDTHTRVQNVGAGNEVVGRGTPTELKRARIDFPSEHSVAGEKRSEISTFKTLWHFKLDDDKCVCVCAMQRARELVHIPSRHAEHNSEHTLISI